MLAVLPPVAARAEEELPPGGTFVDDDGIVHEGYIEAIAAQEITFGCTRSGDRYCPQQAVTRGQMAAFLARALGLSASANDHFTDDDGHMFEAAINAIADAGITSGCSATGFCPDALITRGQMAQFMVKAKGYPAATTDYFRDDDGHMFEGAINAIAQAGITSGCNPPDNTAYCPQSPTTRAQMATFLSRMLGLAPMRPESRDRSSISPEDAIATWFPEMTDKALRVARCESGLNPAAVNPRGFHGLFQISEQYHRRAFEDITGVSWDEGIHTAYYNAQYGREVYDRAGGWSPWPECGKA